MSTGGEGPPRQPDGASGVIATYFTRTLPPSPTPGESTGKEQLHSMSHAGGPARGKTADGSGASRWIGDSPERWVP